MIEILRKNALYVSFGIILVVWIQKVIRNTWYIESIKASFESMPRVFLQAFVVGLLTIVVVTLLLLLSKEKFTEIGFNRQNMPKQLKTGFLFGVLIFIADTFMVSPIVAILLPKTAAEGVEMSKLFASIHYLPVWIFIVLFKGGFSEELWRIFVLTRFENFLGKFGLLFALVVSSVIFGMGHLYQGVGGMISTSIVGLAYALVYLRKRRAWEVIYSHATYDLIAVALGFIIYSN